MLSDYDRPSDSRTTAKLLSVRDLRVKFRGISGLRGINLDINKGEALGVVGESGCGKSITWLAALNLLPKYAEVTGSIRLEGEELLNAERRALDKIRGGRIAMIFQDPAAALNPIKKVGKQVEESLRLHNGLTGTAATAEARRLFELVGIPDAGRRLSSYPHELSGGQNQRVMIAMALSGRPEILIADEPTTALDATIQAQILDLLRRLQKELDMALVLISHDLNVVAEMCSRIGVMYAGRVVEAGSTERIFRSPTHPYTRGLINAMPDMTGPNRRLMPIAGNVPEPQNFPVGCAFAPRCTFSSDECGLGVPDLSTLEPDHAAACIRSGTLLQAAL